MHIFEQYSDIVTVQELCRMLKIGRNSAYGLLATGEIQAKRIGGRYKIRKDSVIRYLSNALVSCKDLSEKELQVDHNPDILKVISIGLSDSITC